MLKTDEGRVCCVGYPVLSDPGELCAEGGESRVHIWLHIRAPAGLQLECSGIDNYARELNDLLPCVRGVRGVCTDLFIYSCIFGSFGFIHLQF